MHGVSWCISPGGGDEKHRRSKERREEQDGKDSAHHAATDLLSHTKARKGNDQSMRPCRNLSDCFLFLTSFVAPVKYYRKQETNS
mmetsp:Transcript_37247/g.81101  ORF Transcript_37247/g.81101 Transcript_37247/m.81101 type:complete len:85 (+) Transcript_37247:1887-2141(+)